MSISRKNARRLAIRYSAYLESSHISDLNGLIVWGDMLIESQKATKVHLLSIESIESRIGNARALLASTGKRTSVEMLTDDYAAEEASEAEYFKITEKEESLS